MILKIEGIEEGRWVIIDNIGNIDFNSKKEVLYETTEGMNRDWCLIHHNWPHSVEGRTCKIVSYNLRDESIVRTAVFDGQAFLCNDNGQTIEKL